MKDLLNVCAIIRMMMISFIFPMINRQASNNTTIQGNPQITHFLRHFLSCLAFILDNKHLRATFKGSSTQQSNRANMRLFIGNIINMNMGLLFPFPFPLFFCCFFSHAILTTTKHYQWLSHSSWLLYIIIFHLFCHERC